MFTRKSATVVATAAAAWAGALAIAIAYADIHKLFILFVAAAAVLTLSLCLPFSQRTTSASPGAATEVPHNSQQGQPGPKVVFVPAEPVEIAHQLGFRQGVQAQKLRQSSQLPPMLSFESFSSAPPN
jgi:hypothetical protein